MVNFWKNKNVLVTGISGFIASNLANRLVDLGSNVVGITRNNQNSIKSYIKVYVGDVKDYKFLCDIISSNEIDIIFHLAASAIVRKSARDPLSTYNTNIIGTVAVLEAAKNVGRCSKIFCMASDKAYGDHEELPYKEYFPLQPKNTYDVSKACGDLIARSYAYNYNMPVITLRCANVYGPGDYNLSRIIPNTILRLKASQAPQLYSDVESMVREFIYIDDVVEAFTKLGEAYQLSDCYNIGGGEYLKIVDLVKLISTKIGMGYLEPIIIPRETVFKEIEKQYICADKIRNDIGWSVKTSLEDGLQKTINWYLNEL